MKGYFLMTSRTSRNLSHAIMFCQYVADWHAFFRTAINTLPSLSTLYHAWITLRTWYIHKLSLEEEKSKVIFLKTLSWQLGCVQKKKKKKNYDLPFRLRQRWKQDTVSIVTHKYLPFGCLVCIVLTSLPCKLENACSAMLKRDERVACLAAQSIHHNAPNHAVRFH